jgi:hypothetical protein
MKSVLVAAALIDVVILTGLGALFLSGALNRG